MTRAAAQLNPFKSADARRLAVLFAVVYFSQGMYHVTDQLVTLTLKDRLGLSASQVATFGWFMFLPWVIKPVYGLLSDSVPLFRRRRKSYFLLTTALASATGLALASLGVPSYWRLGLLISLLGLGLAFTDVLTDAMMVENGKPRGLTGAFQSVQWAAINVATIAVGVIGGYLAERRDLRLGFLIAAAFPALALLMGAAFIREAPAKADREVLRETWRGIRAAVTERSVWVVAGFLFFWTFSPSIGVPLFYFQTETLKFSQQFIGTLTSMGAAAGIVGAALYAPLSRRVSLRRLIVASIGAGVLGTLGYLCYQGAVSAMVIDTLYGAIGMITQLAFLDLAAKACPQHAEGTFFALLTSVYNLGIQGSQMAGGYLYDWVGYAPLVLISAGMTALAWPLVPLIKIDQIEARARAAPTASLA